jgi:hypothetical protein
METQDVGDARNVECLPKKAAGREQSKPKREAIWAANSKDIGPSEYEALQMSDIDLEDLLFVLLDFSFVLVQYFLVFLLIPLFGDGNNYSVPLYLGSI